MLCMWLRSRVGPGGRVPTRCFTMTTPPLGVILGGFGPGYRFATETWLFHPYYSNTQCAVLTNELVCQFSTAQPFFRQGRRRGVDSP
jgi:hypothetical protein